jgi:hypothetical protein
MMKWSEACSMLMDLPRAFGVSVPSHPKDSSKILIESARTLALSAASKQGAGLGCHIAPKDQLVLVASTDWTGLAAQFPPNRSDLANLFLHRCPSSGEKHAGVEAQHSGSYWDRVSNLKIP